MISRVTFISLKRGVASPLCVNLLCTNLAYYELPAAAMNGTPACHPFLPLSLRASSDSKERGGGSLLSQEIGLDNVGSVWTELMGIGVGLGLGSQPSS